MNKVWSFFTLFTSAGTLVCCALPALFVALGAGAAFAGLVTEFPQLIWISENKLWVFIFAGISLAAAGFMQWRTKDLPCPIDREQAEACASARRVSKIVYGVSLVIYLVGAGFAFSEVGFAFLH